MVCHAPSKVRCMAKQRRPSKYRHSNKLQQLLLTNNPQLTGMNSLPIYWCPPNRRNAESMVPACTFYQSVALLGSHRCALLTSGTAPCICPSFNYHTWVCLQKPNIAPLCLTEEKGKPLAKHVSVCGWTLGQIGRFKCYRERERERQETTNHH